MAKVSGIFAKRKFPKPDYAKIGAMERELGLAGNPEPIEFDEQIEIEKLDRAIELDIERHRKKNAITDRALQNMYLGPILG